MPYPNESAARLRTPGDFAKDSFRRTRGGKLYGRITVPSSISIIWGKLKGKDKPSDPVLPQALRFDKSKWTVAAAKKWLADNGIKFMKFEPPAKAKASEEPDSTVLNTEVERAMGEENTRLTAKDIGKMSDAEIGQWVRARLKELAARKEVSISLFADDDEEDIGDIPEVAMSDLTIEESDEDLAQEEPATDTDAEEELDLLAGEAETPDDFAETFTLKNVAVFETGTHKGIKYTTKHLDEMVKNFSKLNKLVKPMFKLGHGSQRGLGQPAAGWATALRRVGNRLYADFAQVPKAVYKLLKNGAYRRISAEIYPNFRDPQGKRHGMVFAAAAALGADFPAIKTLPDIMKLYQQNLAQNEEVEIVMFEFEDKAKELDTIDEAEFADFTMDGTTTDTAEDTTDTEETQETSPQTPAEESPQKAEGTRELADALTRSVAANKKLADRLSEVEKELEEAKRARRTAEETVFVENLIKAGKLLPAQVPEVTRLFDALAPISTVVEFTTTGEDGAEIQQAATPYTLFRSHLESSPQVVDFSEQATGDTDAPGKTSTAPEYKKEDLEVDPDSLELVQKVRQYMEDHPTKADGTRMSYEDALIIVAAQV